MTCKARLWRLVYQVAVLTLAAAGPAQAAGVAIVGATLQDNGDGDGFADTRETVELWLTVRNRTGVDLREVALRLQTDSPNILAVSTPWAWVGDLGADEQRTAATPFVFTVADVDRAGAGLGPTDPFAATFDVSVEALPFAPLTEGPGVTLELDLDATGGAGPTSFFEDFEDGTLGAFTSQNLDQGLASLEASDDHRCQYNDPDWLFSNAPGAPDCFAGPSSTNADAVFWRADGPGSPSGGRAFNGTGSLHYGIDLGTGQGFTTPLAVLDAVRTTEPINLDPGASSELSFVHQTSLVDDRWINARPGRTSDRAVVMAQRADGAGDPVGDWIRLEPYLNVYDSQAEDNFFSCMFDPVDDGNTEDDFFEPSDPQRRYGPSSTCYPQPVYSDIGATVLSDPLAVGSADGPGLLGASGPGTWIESRFDLGRFRGQRIRLRLLVSAKRTSTIESWEFFLPGPDPRDDGWWVDDVQVTGTLTDPATLEADTTDNSALPGDGDADGDGVPDAADVCPGVPDPGQADGDGDGVGDACDVCPAAPDPDQTDTDLDGVGDACQPCPAGPDSDDDGDGVPCSVDVCPGDADPAQQDADLDGVGDACDACPQDRGNDGDGDGLCYAADPCPTAFGGPDGSARLSDWLVAGGDVVEAEASPDGSAVVYLADQRQDERFELFAAPLHGGPPVRLNADLPLGGDVLDFGIDGCSQRVVYRADQETDDVVELFSVPLGGGTPLKISAPLAAGERVRSFTIAPDCSTVAYSVLPTGLFAVTTTGGLATPLASGEAITEIQIDVNSMYAVYLDTDPDLSGDLASVPLAGGSPIALAADVYDYRVGPDGELVYYIETFDDGSLRLRYVRIIGGAPAQVSDAGDVVEFALRSDGLGAVYLAAPTVNGQFELIATDFVAQTLTTLNPPLPSGGSVGGFALTPDGDTVVYLADGTVDERFELYAVPFAGGPATTLSGTMPPDGDVREFALEPGAQTVLFTADIGLDERVELHRAEIDTGAVTATGGDLVAGGGVAAVGVIDGAAPKAFYLADQLIRTTVELWVAPGPDGVLDTDGNGVFDFCEPCAGGPGTCCPAADPDGDGLCAPADSCPFDFDPGQADADGDGVGNACDGCPATPDPGQSDGDGDGAGDACDCAPADPRSRPAAEVSTLRLERTGSGTRLVWTAAAGADAYSIPRGTLADLAAGDFGSCLTSGVAGTSFEDTGTPAPGQGWTYLVRGHSDACGAGPLGYGGDGTTRVNVNPARPACRRRRARERPARALSAAPCRAGRSGPADGAAAEGLPRHARLAAGGLITSVRTGAGRAGALARHCRYRAATRKFWVFSSHHRDPAPRIGITTIETLTVADP